jgi:hypothetical protein
MGRGYHELSWLPVPAALVYAAVLLAGFAALYFAVTSMTDPAYRETFFAPTVRELHKILQIHAVYAAGVGIPDTGPDRTTVVRRIIKNLRAAP